MGKDPGQIEHEIRQKREQIGRRIDDLERRIHDDVASVRQEAKGRVSNAFDDTKSVFRADGPMREHPLTLTAGALGIGVLLGVASEGLTSHDGHRSGSDPARQNGHENSFSSGLGNLLSTLLGPATLTAQHELQDLVRTGFDTLKEQISDTADQAQRDSRRETGRDRQD